MTRKKQIQKNIVKHSPPRKRESRDTDPRGGHSETLRGVFSSKSLVTFYPHKRMKDKVVERAEKARPISLEERTIFYAEMGSLIPDEIVTNLVYTTGLSISATGTQAFRLFRANSVFDPDYTGVGAQPNGFDQLAALYSYYRVEACRFEATSIALSTMTEFQTAVVFPSTSTSLVSGLVDAIGNPHSAYAAVPTSARGFTKTLVTHIDIKKFFGITNAIFGSDDYSSTVATNPLKPVYLHFYVQDILEAGNTVSCHTLFKLVYRVRFYSRVQLNRS